MAKSQKDKPKNVFSRIITYVKGAWTELGRVVWPGPQEVLNSSIVVIVTLLFFAAFTFAIDQVSVQIVQLIARIGG